MPQGFNNGILLPQMLIIRKMTEIDLDAVLAIEQACFPRPWTKEHFLAEITSNHSTSVVAEKQGQIAGYLSLSVLFDEAEILDVAVDPLLHGNGIGETIVRWSLKESLKLGASIIRLEVRTSSHPAITLYKKLGFTPTGLRKSYYENGTDALLMEKKLTEEDMLHAVQINDN